MDALSDIASRHGLPLVEDNAHGLFGRYRGRAAGQRRRHLDAELPRDQEPHLRRGRRARDQRSRPGRARRDHPREGHQSQPVLPRPGRQVHVGRRRVELPAVGHPRRLPAARRSRPAPRSRRGGTRSGAATTPSWPAGRPSTASAVRTCRRTASTRPTSTTCCCRRWTPARRSSRTCGRGRSWRCSTTCRCTCPTRGSGSAAAPGQCPVTEDVSDRLVRLPLHYHMSAADQDRVIDAVTSFRP